MNEPAPDDPAALHVRRRLRLDLRPWRESRQFRLLTGAGFVFWLGQMVTYAAVPIQVKQLTGSNTAVGLIAAFEVVPTIVFGLWGGALADRIDRRRMLVRTGVGQVALTALLVLNASLDRPRVWVLFALAPMFVVLSSLQRPSREAVLPRVVDKGQLAAAVSLSSLTGQVAWLIGPAIGALLAATAGAGWAFAVDLVGLAVATVLYTRLDPQPPTRNESADEPRNSLASIAEGVRYAASRRDLLGTYLVDFGAMALAFPHALFPALADTTFRGGGVALLYAAEPVGTLTATLTSGWTGHVRRRGRMVALAAGTWGAAMVLAGATSSMGVVLLALTIGGAADMISGLFRGVIWHETIPDEYRGRLAGVEMLSYTVGPMIGQLRGGVMADAVGVRPTLVIGGSACVALVAVLAAVLRGFWHLRSDGPAPLAAV